MRLGLKGEEMRVGLKTEVEELKTEAAEKMLVVPVVVSLEGKGWLLVERVAVLSPMRAML